MKRTTAAVVLLLLITGSAWLAVALLDPPSPVPASAPPEAFSAERAMEHVRALAGEPRPVGSETHAEARRYIVRRVEELGLDPEVQSAVGRHRSGTVFGTVHNVIARLPGEEGGPAVVLTAHYDSVPAGPGASDDAVGVAVLLETLRALTAGPRPAHDVVALFTDLEENGLLGAEAFASQHPLAEAVGVVLNYEARGTRGPSLMFETGRGNLPVIEHFADTPHPMASSYSYEVYRRLPNDTDFTVFKNRGVPGLNFAHIHGSTGYHTALDSVERLDPASLQHHGANALALARSFADAPELDALGTGGDAVYFNPLGSLFVHYPASWTLPLLVLLAVLSLGVVGLGVARGGVRIGGTLLAFLFQALLVAVLFFLASFAAGALFRTRYDFRIWGEGSSLAWTLFGLGLLALGIATALHRLVGRRLRGADLAAAGILLWLLLSAVLALTAPGASYLTMVPLLFQAVAVGALVAGGADRPDRVDRGREAAAERLGAPAFLLLALAGVVTALIWAPTLALVAVGLQVGAAVVLAAAAGLLVALLAPQIGLVTRAASGARLGWVVPVLLLAAGVAVVVAARAAGGFGPDNPAPTGLLYAEDDTSGEALWASGKLRPDPWTSRVLPEEPERRPLPAFVGHEREMAVGAAAEPVGLPRPRVERVGQGAGPLRLRVVPPGGADRLAIELSPPEAVGSLQVEGRPVEPPEEGPIRLAYYAPPPEGVVLEIADADAAALQVEVVAQWWELPPEARGGPGAKPPGWMTAGFSRTADSTMVRSAWSAGELARSEAAGPETVGGGDGSEGPEVGGGGGRGDARAPEDGVE